MRFGSMFALVCLVVGVNANAATLNTNPSGSEGSSLFLTVWNGTDKSIVVDLGVNALATDFNTFSYNQNFATQLSNAFGSISSSFQYAVLAVSTDILNTGIWTTHTLGNLLPQDTLLNGGTWAGNLNNYVQGNPLSALGQGQTNGPAGVGASSPGYYAGSNFNGSLGSTIVSNQGTNVGSSLFFYSLLAKDFNSTLDNAAYTSKWALSSLGVLTFSGGGSAPVPLPAAVYMLGAALLGLVGIGRRARQSGARAA